MDWIGLDWTGLDPTQKASPIRASSDAKNYRILGQVAEKKE